MCDTFVFFVSQRLDRGPDFGYLPQPAKIVLMVGPTDFDQATTMFSNLGIKVVSGSRFLGDFIGDHSMADDYVAQKVQMWSDCLQHLSEVAKVQPQAAHAAVSMIPFATSGS